MTSAMGSNTIVEAARGRGGMPRAARLHRVKHRLLWLVIAAIGLGGCSLDGLLKSDQLPPDVTDPAITETHDGALAAYRGALGQFRTAFGAGETGSSYSQSFVAMTGLLSDELLATPNAGSGDQTVDRRLLIEGNTASTDGTYAQLHRVRALAGQAIGLLTAYAPDQSALVGHAYALEGYAELFLAELFCSNIPLSTVDFHGDYTYRPGSSTGEVLTHAIALFDSALALVGDSARLVRLAQLGKGRALLGLGDFAGAAAVVADVPDDYVYEVGYTSTTGANAENFARIRNGSWEYTVANGEGLNGLDYRASGDPRAAVTPRGTYTVGTRTDTIYHPDKYAPGDDVTGASPIVLASGLEARLIEAEAALQANPVDGVWLAKLNALRTDGTQDGGGVYTAGTGGVAGLTPLTDPGTPDARVDLLFRERAFWLFLTGHRQGDLRRLIRQYDRDADQLYPIGFYPGQTVGEAYGGDVDAPIPAAERTANPHFTGCAARGA